MRDNRDKLESWATSQTKDSPSRLRRRSALGAPGLCGGRPSPRKAPKNFPKRSAGNFFGFLLAGVASAPPPAGLTATGTTPAALWPGGHPQHPPPAGQAYREGAEMTEPTTNSRAWGTS